MRRNLWRKEYTAHLVEQNLKRGKENVEDDAQDNTPASAGSRDLI